MARPQPALPSRRWVHQTSLFQFAQPAFWLYTVLLVLTGAFALLEQALLLTEAPAGWVLSWVLLAFYLVPMFLIVYFLDLYEREPLSLVLGALLWGAVVATTLAGIANDGWGRVVARLGGPDFAAAWSAALTAPVVEEVLKALGVVVIWLIARDEVDDMLDGFVYGAMVGLGFAVVEDVFYFIAEFGGTPGDVIAGFLVRVVASGLYGHVLYSGLSGMGVAAVVARRRPADASTRALLAAGLFALAVGAHFLWNSPLLNFFPTGEASLTAILVGIPFATAVKGLPFLVVLVLMLKLARRRERAWLRTGLAGELGGPGLAEGELEVLEDPRARRRARRALRATAGPGSAALLGRLQREQINLAMIRSRVDDANHPDVVSQRHVLRTVREALAAASARGPGTAIG